MGEMKISRLSAVILPVPAGVWKILQDRDVHAMIFHWEEKVLFGSFDFPGREFHQAAAMAKAKKKSRNASARSKGPSYKAAHGNEKEEKLRTQKIVPVMEKLVSPDMTDRSLAIGTINTMSDDPTLRTLLLKEKVLKVVLENTIKDSNEEIVSEAYGLLRNLCIEEGYDVAIFLWRQEILKFIEESLNKITTAFEAIANLANGGSSDTKFTKQQVTTVFEFTENVIGLASALATTNEDIFTAISNRLVPGLGQFITSVISYARSTVKSDSNIAISNSLFTAVCEILYTLSEENQNFVDSVSDYPFDEILNEFAQGSKAYPLPALVYLNGLKYNSLLLKLLAKSKSDEINPNAILLEIQGSLINIIKSVDIEQAQKDSEPIASDAPMEEVNKQFIKNIQARSFIESVQVAIEIITAVAETITIDPTEIAAMAAQDDSVVEENEDEDMSGDKDDEEYYIRKHVEVEDDFIDESVFDREEEQVTDETMSPFLKFVLEETIPLIAQLLPMSEFQSRAMAALNNLAWTMHTQAPNAAKWRSNAEQLWTNILPHVTANDNTKYSEIEVLCSAVGVLWAVASTFKGEVPISTEAVNFLISQTSDLPKLYPAEECTEYCVKLVGLLGQLAKVPGRREITVSVTRFFFNTLSSAPTAPVKDTTPVNSPKVVVDVIYGVFEIFGDKSYEYDQELYVQGGLNGKLAGLVMPLRKFFKRIGKAQDPLLRERSQESVSNLVRFVEYKKAEQAN